MVAWERLPQPIAQVPFQGVTYTRAFSPVSGRQELRWEGRDETWTMPVIGYRQTQAVGYPLAWWIPPGNDDVVALLQAHGIAYERLQQPRQLRVQQIRVVKQGHAQIPQPDEADETFAAGSVRVPADQPMRMLAAALLEPASSDSLLVADAFAMPAAPIAACTAPSWWISPSACCTTTPPCAPRSNASSQTMPPSAPMAMRGCNGSMRARRTRRSPGGVIRCGVSWWNENVACRLQTGRQ